MKCLDSTGLARLVILVLIVSACGGSGDDAAPTSVTTQVVSSTTATTTVTSLSSPESSPQEPRTEEIQFDVAGFHLVGDLSLPGGTSPHPAVILVNGSGAQTRWTVPGRAELLDTFGGAGYAVLVWDTPGSGKSTGILEEEHTLTQRAEILAAGIDYLASRPDIQPDRIGLWGISQGGWVMPLALEMRSNVDFMVVVSGGGEDSIEQLGYRIASEMMCQGASPEQGALIEEYGPIAAKVTEYEAYVEAMEILLEIPGMEAYIGSEPASEDEWQPWPAEIDSYLDPMDVIEHVTIPVLAVFGSLDKAVDPVQGSAAYEDALARAGNTVSHVELIEGVGHSLYEQETGCPGDATGALSERYVELLEEWMTARTAG